MKKHHSQTHFGLLLACGLALAVTSTLRAESPPAADSALMRFATQDYLFGNWGGWRNTLSSNGVDFEFFYIGALPSVISGGIEKETVYQGLMAMWMDLDSKKLLGYEGGHFHVSGLWLHGEKPFSDAFIGDLNKVSLIDYPNAFKLWELYYEQKFLGNKLSLKAGLLSVDQDFIRPEWASIFVNQTYFFPTIAFNIFDLPGFPVGRHALPTSPLSAVGARLRIDPTESFFAQAAVYDGNPDRSKTGGEIHLDPEEGALAYFEAGYKLNQRQTDTGLPGTYKVGGYYHSDEFYDNYDTARAFAGLGTGPTVHSGNYGIYATADQTLYRELDAQDAAKQGLGAFARAGYAPEDRNLVEWALDGGLVYRGLIPSRDYDSLGLTAAWMWMSSDLARGQRAVNAVAPGTFKPVDYEGVVELTYKAQLTAWWTLQPSLQRVIHPGGSSSHPDAWVVVLMTTLRF